MGILTFFATILVFALHHAGDCEGRQEEEITKFFADNAYSFGASHPWITPSGQHHGGVTYLTYQGPAEGSYIVSYNHTSKAWEGPVKVLDNPMGGVDPEVKPSGCATGSCTDNHGAPHIAITNDGYINVFGGGHGGCDKPIEGTIWEENRFGGENRFGTGCKYRKPFSNDPSHIGLQRHARSLKPEDINEWESVPLADSGLSPYASYGENVITQTGGGNEAIYLIVRHGTHTADWTYQKSTDGGKTFEEPITIFKYEKTAKRTWISWYVRCFGANDRAVRKKDRIGCFATWHHHEVGETELGNRIHGSDRRNIYYVEIDALTGNMYNVYGTQLSSPVTLEEATKHALVHETGDKEYVEPLDGNFNKHGVPEVLIHSYRNPAEDGWVWGARATESIMYAAFNTKNMNWYDPIQIPCDASNSQAVFVKYKDKGVSDVVAQEGNSLLYFRSIRHPDNSISFSFKRKKSLEGESERPMRIFDIRNPHEDGWIVLSDSPEEGSDLWKDYYKAVYLFGNNGIVGRNKSESTGLWERCWAATTTDECYVTCPTNNKLLKVELNPSANVHTFNFRIDEKQNSGRWKMIRKVKNLQEFPFSFEECIPASSEFFFQLYVKRKNDSPNSDGNYKLTWGADLLVNKEYPVPEETGDKMWEQFYFGSGGPSSETQVELFAAFPR